MKKQIILFLGALLITFLTVYIINLSSSYYPVTSTFGIEGNKVSYRLDKIHYGRQPFKVMLITELNGIDGKLIWKQNSGGFESPMMYDDCALYSEIPIPESLTKIDYRVKLNFNKMDYLIPRDGSFISLHIFGKIPKFIEWFHYILLFTGIFLGTRIGLDYFDENKKSKKLSVIVLAVMIIFSFMINPLKNSYKLEVINKSIPELSSLFDLQAILFLITWLLAVPLIFNNKISVIASVIASIITLIIFVSFPFVL